MSILPCCTPELQCDDACYSDFYSPACTSGAIAAYNDDAEAGAAGVLAGTLYKTSASNTLGLPANVLMVKA